MFLENKKNRPFLGNLRQGIWLIIALIAASAVPAVFADTKNSTRVLIFLSGFGYWFFAALCWRSRWTRVFSVLLVLAWCGNAVISILFQYEYGGGLTVLNAQSMLLTNAGESRGMMLSHWEWVISGLVLFGAVLWWLHKLRNKDVIASKILWRGVAVFGVYLLIIPLVYTLNGKNKRVGFSFSETVLSRTPLYNVPQFIRAAADIREEKKLRGQVIVYDLKTNETDVDIYVIVIGESARRSNLSLYGYSRETSPNADSEREKMFLFKQAIAPAPMTFMAVALSMCRAGDGAGMPPSIADNVINVAKQAGFKTYWLDRDPQTPGNLLDHIAGFANKGVFQIGKYDDDMIPALAGILSGDEGKKLIVIHIGGSHSPYAPSQYLPETARFMDGEDEDLNNYDNSIYATDVFLGKMFSLLEQHRASVLYYSDHAVARKTTFGHSRFRHGSVKFPREAVDVPMFIWFSSAAPSTYKGGVVDGPYSTGDNYHLISDWLGVEFVGEQQISSALRKDYVPRSEVLILGTDQKPQPYSRLPHEGK